MSAPDFTRQANLRRVFNSTVETDPLAIFNAVKDKPLTAMQPARPTQAVDYLCDTVFKPDDPTLELHSSFYDVRMIMHAGFERVQPELSFEEALEVATDGRTARLLAQIALHPSVDYQKVIWENPGVILVPERQYLDIQPGALDHSVGKGCPFAGDNPRKKLIPLFLRYATWVAQFSTYDYYEEGGPKVFSPSR